MFWIYQVWSCHKISMCIINIIHTDHEYNILQLLYIKMGGQGWKRLQALRWKRIRHQSEAWTELMSWICIWIGSNTNTQHAPPLPPATETSEPYLYQHPPYHISIMAPSTSIIDLKTASSTSPACLSPAVRWRSSWRDWTDGVLFYITSLTSAWVKTKFQCCGGHFTLFQ